MVSAIEGALVVAKARRSRAPLDQMHPDGRPEYLKDREEPAPAWRRAHRAIPAAPNHSPRRAAWRAARAPEVSVPEIKAPARSHLSQRSRTCTTSPSGSTRMSSSSASAWALVSSPWFPVATGRLAVPDGPGGTPAQLALAWLLENSPVVLPIPGTSRVAHLEENMAAADIGLTPEQIQRLDAAT